VARARVRILAEDGVEHPYGNERVLGAGTLKRQLADEGVRCVGIHHFRLFPNHPAFASGLAIEQVFPKFLTPFFSHYNNVGRNGAS